MRPKFVKLGLCSWRAQLVPPMVQLVQSPHASSLYSTRAVLAYTTFATDVAACAFFARLEPLLDPCAPDMQHLCHRCLRVWSLRTPRAFTRPGFHSTYELSRRCYNLDSLQTPRAFTLPRSPSWHELSRRCYRLCIIRTLQAFTRPGFSGWHE